MHGKYFKIKQSWCVFLWCTTSQCVKKAYTYVVNLLGVIFRVTLKSLAPLNICHHSFHRLHCMLSMYLLALSHVPYVPLYLTPLWNLNTKMVGSSVKECDDSTRVSIHVSSKIWLNMITKPSCLILNQTFRVDVCNVIF